MKTIHVMWVKELAKFKSHYYHRCTGVLTRSTVINEVATLRQMESNHRVFMFFDNDHVRKGKSGKDCKRLYVIGRPVDRESALDEAEDVLSLIHI